MIQENPHCSAFEKTVQIMPCTVKTTLIHQTSFHDHVTFKFAVDAGGWGWFPLDEDGGGAGVGGADFQRRRRRKFLQRLDDHRAQRRPGFTHLVHRNYAELILSTKRTNYTLKSYPAASCPVLSCCNCISLVIFALERHHLPP